LRGISRPRGSYHARPECECSRLLAGPAEHGVILRASVDGADQLYDRALLIIPVGRYGYAARGAGPDARGIRGQVLRWSAGTLPTAVLSAGAVPARLWPGAWLGRGVLRGRVGGAAAAAVAANGDWRAAGDGGGASHSCPPRARNRRRARRHGRHQLVHLQPVLEPDHATRRERALAGLPAPVRQPTAALRLGRARADKRRLRRLGRASALWQPVRWAVDRLLRAVCGTGRAAILRWLVEYVHPGRASAQATKDQGPRTKD